MSQRPKDIQLKTSRLAGAHHLLIISLIILVLSLGLSYLFLRVNFIPNAASTQRELIDNFIKILLAIAGVVFSIIVTVSVYSVIFFRRHKGDNSDALPIRHNTMLEIFWTVIPLVIVITLGIYGAKVLDDISAAETLTHSTTQTTPMSTSENALLINVTASRFLWQFEYPDYGFSSYILEVPVNRRIVFDITSTDVVHSFWVQEWGPKQDAVPGMRTTLTVTPTGTGQFLVQCSQLCGDQHTNMTALVKVVPVAEFDQWVQQQKSSATK